MESLSQKKKYINEAKNDHWKICVYGLGYLGYRLYRLIPGLFSLEPDHYCDGDNAKVDAAVMPGLTGISRCELLATDEPVLVFVLVDNPTDRLIEASLSSNKMLYTVTIRDLIQMDEVIRSFYGDELYAVYNELEDYRFVKGKTENACLPNKGDEEDTYNNDGKIKIAVYTCVTGGYDHVREPMIVEEGCDYFIFSDDDDQVNEVYQRIDVDSVLPDKNLNNKDKNRFCKLHPHVLFKDYDYSIYVDGSIHICRPVAHNINRVGNCGLSLHNHRSGDCVYSEGIFLTWLGVAEKEEIIREASTFMKEGLPKHFGLRECSMIVTDIKNPSISKLYEKWYEEYMHGSKRDQQALIYTLWKMGLSVYDIGNLGGEYYLNDNPEINWSISEHYKNSSDKVL